jgi:bile acid:Na+ symporter, BASS family
MQSSPLTDVFLPAALFVIMLGLGLSLTLADFRRVLTSPRAVIVGAVAQLILLPLLGFGLAAWLLPHQPALAVGLILLAMCPGGSTANLFTHIGGGDTALCLTLTAISSLVKVFTIPLVVNYALVMYHIGGDTPLQLNVLDSIAKIVVITILPAALGMIIRRLKPALADRAERPVKIASAVFLVLVIAGTLYRERANLADYFAVAGPAALLLNLLGMGLGFLLPRLAKLPLRQQLTISIETSIQNGTLAITIASATHLLNNGQMAIPAAVYSLIMFATVGLLLLAVRRQLATAG